MEEKGITAPSRDGSDELARIILARMRRDKVPRGIAS